MPATYSRHTLETKLRVVEAAQRGDAWEHVALVHGVKLNTARDWVRRHVRRSEPVVERPRGGSARLLVTADLVEFLLKKLSINPDHTLRELVDLLEAETGVRVAPQTIKNHVDAECFTLKQMHKEPQYMNTERNKQKRREFLVRLQEHQVAGKTIVYMDETNFNLWSTRTRGRSMRGRRAVKKMFAGGRQNMHVVPCIHEHGLVYHETRFGSNKIENTQEFVRNMLRYAQGPGGFVLANVVVVLDNAPCHSRIEQVFEEDEFAAATLLRLGPYSPMLNPIESVFSVFKSHMKAFLRERRVDILAVPEGVTMKAHRQSFLQLAAMTCLPQAVTIDNCRTFYRHTLQSGGHAGRIVIDPALDPTLYGELHILHVGGIRCGEV